jgi:aspartokinase-like uncharacterized kinase
MREDLSQRRGDGKRRKEEGSRTDFFASFASFAGLAPLREVPTADALIKVGGSLLEWPGLPASLSGYLAERRGERLVLLAGGGAAADFVRRLDEQHGLGEERSHALALRSLDLTAHALASLIETLIVVEDASGIESAWAEGRIPVLAPRIFLEEDDRSADPLPHSWDVTSDSIAARVAVRLGARELVLLKSAAMPSTMGRKEAARAGLVDAAFPEAAREVTHVLVRNLRDPDAVAVALREE